MSQYKVSILIDAQNNANKVLQWLKAQVESVKGSITDFAKRNQWVFQGMALAGTASLWAITVWVNKSIQAANDYGESLNALKVVFWESSKELEKFWETANKSAWLSKTAFNQLATPVGAMLQNMWQSANEAAKNTINLTKRASDMASVFNVDVTEAMQAISAGLRWESDPLERFWVSLKDSQLKAYALRNWLISVGHEMTEQEKTTARLWLLFEQTAKLEWDFGNTSDQLANKKRILNATIANISTTLWQSFLPIITDVLQKITPIIEKVGSWIEANPTLARNIIIATGAIAWLVAWLWALWLALPAIIAWIWLLTWPIGLIIAGVVALWLARSTNFLWIRDKTKEVIDFVWPYVKQWIEAIKVITEQILGWIKTFWTQRGDEITAVVKVIIDVVWTMFKLWFEILSTYVSTALESIKTIIGIFADLYNGRFSEMRDKIKSLFTTMWWAVLKVFTDILESMWDIVDRIIWGITTKIQNAIQSIKSAISNITDISVWSSSWKIAWARANGWPVTGWSAYLVGERWPELYVPKSSGYVVPNSSLWWVNVSISGVNISNWMDLNSFKDYIEWVIVGSVRNLQAWIY